MEQVTLIAPAKINWGLDIVGKRADGYHLLCTLMQSVGLFDRVRIQKSERDCCVCSPPLYGNGENLALRAWHLLKQEYVLPGGLCLEIDKGIPEGGGLAGGSTDAAAVLLGVDRLFRLGLGEERLADLGLRLGADLPFCLKGGLALVEGIGERLLPQRALRSYHLVLVNPGFPVSTAEVYRQFSFDQIAAHPDLKGLLDALEAGDRSGVAACCGNLLETPAFTLHPQIACLKERCRSLGLVSLMSGSGGSVWGLADSADEAEKAAEVLKREGYPFVHVVRTLSTGPNFI